MQLYPAGYDMCDTLVDSGDFHPAATLNHHYATVDGQSFLPCLNTEDAPADSFSTETSVLDVSDRNSLQSSPWTVDSAGTPNTPVSSFSAGMECTSRWSDGMVHDRSYAAHSQNRAFMNNSVAQPFCPAENALMDGVADQLPISSEWSKRWQAVRDNEAESFANSTILAGCTAPLHNDSFAHFRLMPRTCFDGHSLGMSNGLLANSMPASPQQSNLPYRGQKSAKHGRRVKAESRRSESPQDGNRFKCTITEEPGRRLKCVHFEKCRRGFRRQEHLTRHMRNCRYSDLPQRSFYCPLAIEFGESVCPRNQKNPFRERSDNLTQHLQTHCSGFATHQSRNSTFHKALVESVICRADYTEPGHDLTLQNRETRIRSVKDGLEKKLESACQTTACESKWNVHIDHDYMQKLFPNGFRSCENIASGMKFERYQTRNFCLGYDDDTPWCCGWVSGGPKTDESTINLPSQKAALARMKRCGNRLKGQRKSSSRRSARL